LESQIVHDLILLFLKLLMAHLVSDFLIQPNDWIRERKEKKFRSVRLYVHILIVTVLSWVFPGDISQWQIPLFIGITHLFIDIWKSYRPDTLLSFISDQLAHVMMIVLAILLFTKTGMEETASVIIDINPLNFWVVATAFFLVSWPAAYFISAAISRWQDVVAEKASKSGKDGLPSAGMWIGILERILILILILVNQFGAVGFLIAAKSVFRFGSISEPDDRILAEYILIGTLASFATAIVIGLAAGYLLTAF